MAATHYDSTSALLRRIDRAKRQEAELIAQEIEQLEAAIREWEQVLENQPARGLELRCTIAKRCVCQLTERLEGTQSQ